MPQRNQKLVLKQGEKRVKLVDRFRNDATSAAKAIDAGISKAADSVNTATDDIDRGTMKIGVKTKEALSPKGNALKNADGSDKPRHWGGGGRLIK